MKIETIKFDNSLKNFSYLIKIQSSVFCIDPYDGKECFKILSSMGWKLDYILNSHTHYDHIRGNEELVELTGAKILCNEELEGKFSYLKPFFTPGHAKDHYCYLFSSGRDQHFFSADLIFRLGIGNTRLPGADINDLYCSIQEIKKSIPPQSLLHPGHFYYEENKKFTEEITGDTDSTPFPYTFKDELKNNLFLQDISKEDFILLRQKRDEF